MGTIRSFIAIPLAPDVQTGLRPVLEQFHRTDADVRWDMVEKMHITLRFLGNTREDLVPQLSEKLGDIARRFTPMEIAFAGVGAFPNERAPRVVWVGIRPEAALAEVQIEIEQACRVMGFPPEDRAFHPHLTLGRVKGTRNLGRLTEALKTVTFEPIPQRCTELILMKSVLRPEGAVYTALNRFPFQS